MKMTEDCGPYPDSDTSRIAILEAELKQLRQNNQTMASALVNMSKQLDSLYWQINSLDERTKAEFHKLRMSLD